MPAFVTGAIIAGAVAGSAFSIAAGLTLGFSWGAFGAALVLGGVARALAPKPKAASFGDSSVGGMQTVRQPVAPWQIIYGKRRVSGVITYVELTHEDNHVLHMVVTFAGHPCNAITKIYFDEYELQLDSQGREMSSRYIHESGTASHVNVFKSLGDEAEGVQPFPELVAWSRERWTAQHCQTGRTKVYFRLHFHRDKFPQGIPNITAEIEGVCDVRDPRDDSVGYSNNAALCRAHYLANAAFGLGADFDDEIEQDQLEAAANEADEEIELADETTEPRYTINGAFTADEAPEEVLARMNAASAGHTVHVGATWWIHVGGYGAPTLELTADDLAGPVEIQANVSRRDGFNSVIAKIASEADRYQPIDVPALVSDAFIAQDDGEQIWGRQDYTPFVTKSSLGQRLQKIELLRARQALTISAPWKLKALRALTGRTVAVTLEKYGWNSKVFDVETFAFAVENGAGAGAGPRLVVMLGLHETAASVYEWDTSEEQAQDAAPNSGLPDPFTIGAPGAPVVTESQYETRDGSGVKSRALVTWAAPSEGQVELFVLRYKLAADAEDAYLEIAPRQSRSAELLDLAPGVYDFGAKSLSFQGVSSAWSTSQVEIRGLTAAPADVTGLSIQAAGGLALLRWDLHTDLFVREGGFIEFRHSEAEAALASWEESFSIGERVAGNTNQAALPLKGGTYLVKAISQTGRRSELAAAVSTKQATVANFVNVATLQEDDEFSGTHSNTVAPDGVLKIAATGLVDDIPDFDTIAALDSFGGIAGAGAYDFAAGLDLGSEQRIRLTSQLVGTITNVNDLLDSRAESIDGWEDFDGSAGAVADAYIEVRETDDDPASSPTWSGWKRLDSAEFQARAFEFRIQLITADDSYNVLLSQARVQAAQLY